MRHDRAHGNLLQELQQERAAALLRISKTLESLLDQLRDARTRVDAADASARAREVERYRELRAQAVQYRWYLEVQREAIGLRGSHRLDEFYAIPAPID